MNDGAAAHLGRAIGRVLVIVLALAAILLHARYAAQLDHDGENSGDESESLAALARVADGQPLYRDYRQPPHLLTPYMPLFYTVPGSLARWADCRGVDAFVVGRCYVYTCWLGIGALLYGLARQAGATRQPATVGALLWFATELTPAYAITFRSDAPQLFFSLAAVWIYLRGHRLTHLTGAMALLVIAFLHKQSAVVPLVVLVVAEWQQGRRRRAALAAGGWAVAVGSALWLAQRLTQGAFALNTFQALATLGTPAQVFLVLTLTAIRGLPAWLGGGLGCRTTGDRSHGLWRWYFGLALGFAFASSWKFGSAQNYYFEPLAAGCVLTALWLTTDATRQPWLRLGWLALALAVTINSLWLRAAQWSDWSPALVAHRASGPREARDWEQLERCLGSLAEPVLIEDMYLAARHGGTPYLMNASLLSSLQRRGHFDDTGILRDIAAGRFSAILTVAPLDSDHGFRHFPASWRTAIGQRYRLARTCCRGGCECVDVYVPAPAD